MISRTRSTPAPVGGWNARDSIADMPEDDAVTLDNFWPTPADVMLRKGRGQYTTGFSAAVESLMSYTPPTGTKKLFAASGTDFYLVSSGVVGAAVVSGLTNSRWDSVQFTNADPTSYLICMNGVDKPQYWNNSAWIAIDAASTPAITGVATTKLKAPMVFKRRLWAIETDSLRAWYLPVDAVGGLAAVLDLSGIAMNGGSLVALANWTIDGGQGLDDYWVAVTTNGEIILYKGTDPSSATTWALVGVWKLGLPIGGSRCFMKFAGDVLYNSGAGLVPLSKALQSALTNERVAVSDNILGAMQYATETYGASFGWGLMFYPGAQMLMINVPTGTTSSDQYCMNTVSQAWCRFKNIFAYCWAMHDGVPYFGGANTVGKFWQQWSDDGANIVGDVEQAYSYFKNPGRIKDWKMCRPVFMANGSPAISVVLNTDFAGTTPINTATFTVRIGGLWGVGLWGVALWGGGLSVYRDWQTISGSGIAGALRMRVAAQGIEARWQATDWVYELGGVL